VGLVPALLAPPSASAFRVFRNQQKPLWANILSSIADVIKVLVF
jgi:hypothetical protein